MAPAEAGGKRQHTRGGSLHRAEASGKRQMRKAMASAPEAVGKLLVVMQGDCAPTTSRMAGELLRVVRLEQEGKVEDESDEWSPSNSKRSCVT